MSTLWTPSGEHEPRPDPDELPDQQAGSLTDEAAEAEMARVRDELLATPVVDIIANHVVGLWQLAVLHLGLEGGPEGGTEGGVEEQHPPQLAEARLAIDAVAGLVEGLGAQLGPHEGPLREALAQLRLAFVQVSQGAGPAAGVSE